MWQENPLGSNALTSSSLVRATSHIKCRRVLKLLCDVMVSIEDFGSSRRGSNPLTTTRPKWSNYAYSIIILRCEVRNDIFIGMTFNQLLKHKT